MEDDCWSFGGHPTTSEIDDEDLVTLLADFLASFVHQLVFLHHRGLPFGSGSFLGLLFSKCTDPPVANYIDRARESVANWLGRRELIEFRAQITCKGRGTEQSRSKEAEYSARIHRLANLSSEKNEAEFEFAELKKQLRNSLHGMQLNRLQIEHREDSSSALFLRLSCVICTDITFLNKHEWTPVDDTHSAQFSQIPVIAPIPNIDTTVARIVFLGKES